VSKKLKFFSWLTFTKSSLIKFIERILANSLNRNKNLSPEIDQQLISQLPTSRWPAWSQLKQLPHYLNSREWLVLRVAIIMTIVGLVGAGLAFYWQHSVLVPKQGGEYTEGLIGSPNLINPLLSQYNDVDRDLTRLIFNGLLKYDQQGNLTTDLAEKINISTDQKQIIITLKNNILWHDGEQVTANDVIFTIASIQEIAWQSPYRAAFTNVQVEKIDDLNVKISLDQGALNFLNNLIVGLIPEHLWSTVSTSNVTLAELNKKPIGTGPFQFSTLTKDRSGSIKSLVLIRNDRYFTTPAFLDSITFKFYGDYETGVQALKNKNVDGLNFLPREFTSEADKNKDLILHELSRPQYAAIFFNTKKNSLLKDQAIRKGLALAIDRDKIINEVLGGEGQIIDSPILPGYTGHTEDVAKYNYNVNEASSWLDKTGWLKVDGQPYRQKKGAELIIKLTTVENPEYQQVVAIIKDNWEKIGVKTAVEIVPKEQIREQIIKNRNYEALLFGQIIKSDPYPFWHSSQVDDPGLNLSIWADKTIDTQLEQIRQTSDEQQRAQLIVDWQKNLTNFAPAIFLYNPIYIYPIDKKILNVNIKNINSTPDRFNDITNWHIKSKRVFQW